MDKKCSPPISMHIFMKNKKQKICKLYKVAFIPLPPCSMLITVNSL